VSARCDFTFETASKGFLGAFRPKPLFEYFIFKSMFGIWCLRQKRAIFRQFFAFLKAHSGATQLKKGEKLAEILMPIYR
jgi:hypothetical protein